MNTFHINVQMCVDVLFSLIYYITLNQFRTYFSREMHTMPLMCNKHAILSAFVSRFSFALSF